jgi:hypothetical protein
MRGRPGALHHGYLRRIIRNPQPAYRRRARRYRGRVLHSEPADRLAGRNAVHKEPDTIEWIAGFSPGEVFYDVGANVGMCSIWAAVASKTAVYAFEAESQNFALLNRNIWINRLAGQVAALPLAIADTVGLDKLYLSEFIAGGSCHN